jgi:hypothetical protein
MRAANARLRRGRETATRARPRSGRGKPAEAARGRLLRVDQEVVHDLSHELGNYFHKLYYWTDCIRSGATESSPEGSPTDALDGTLHRLQAFLNLALEYFQPVEPQLTTMRGGDVAKAFESLLRGENPAATVESSSAGAAATAPVAIDTMRLSTGLRTVARLLGGGTGTTLRVGADVARGQLVLTLDATGSTADEAARRAQKVVEWAVAARMLELHGGRLETSEERPGAARCTLTLPLLNE